MLQTNYSPWGFNDPFADMRRLQGTMNQLFDSGRSAERSGTYPFVNFWAGQDSIVMSAELPGLAEQDIELTVKDKMISIRGTYPEPETGDDVTWHRRERPAGSFLRSIELPFRIETDHIDARFENGVLIVEMQRPEADKPKKIQIKSS
jgi:HSP20 family protein